MTTEDGPLDRGPHDPSLPPEADEAADRSAGAPPPALTDAPDGGADDASGDLAPSACPYLAAPGGWRSTGAVRDHRCTALDPAAPVALDKQRRLCLVGAHRTCPTYVAARSAREHALAGLPAGWEPERRFVRTAPVVIEAAPRRRAVPVFVGSHRFAEAAVAIMAIVVVVLVGSRVLGGAQPEPTPSPTPVTTPGPAASVVAGVGSGSPVPSAAVPSPSPSAPASAEASASVEASPQPSPSASSAVRRYKVKGGDTLSSIAARFGVAWQAIAKANKIKSPYRIVRGQVLVIPTGP